MSRISKFVHIWSRWFPLMCVDVLSGITGVRFLFAHIYVTLKRYSLKSPEKIIFNLTVDRILARKHVPDFVRQYLLFLLFWGSIYTVTMCSGVKLYAHDCQLMLLLIYFTFFTLKEDELADQQPPDLVNYDWILFSRIFKNSCLVLFL